jgi:hypothetical protein
MAFRNFGFSVQSTWKLWKLDLTHVMFHQTFQDDDTWLKYVVCLKSSVNGTRKQTLQKLQTK